VIKYLKFLNDLAFSLQLQKRLGVLDGATAEPEQRSLDRYRAGSGKGASHPDHKPAWRSACWNPVLAA